MSASFHDILHERRSVVCDERYKVTSYPGRYEHGHGQGRVS
jgi:hypothetical protein